MFEDLVRQFVSSDLARTLVQEVTTKQALQPDQARNAVQATAEGTADALRSGAFDLKTLLGGTGIIGEIAGALGLGGQKGAGGIPNELVKQVTDYVARKTGLTAGIVAAVVTMALPKVLEFAKKMMASTERGTSPPA